MGKDPIFLPSFRGTTLGGILHISQAALEEWSLLPKAMPQWCPFRFSFPPFPPHFPMPHFFQDLLPSKSSYLQPSSCLSFPLGWTLPINILLVIIMIIIKLFISPQKWVISKSSLLKFGKCSVCMCIWVCFWTLFHSTDVFIYCWELHLHYISRYWNVFYFNFSSFSRYLGLFSVTYFS